MATRCATMLFASALLFFAMAAPAAASDGPAGHLLSLINAYRTASGLEPLAPDATLDRVAQGHGEDMARRAYFSHVTPEGGNLTHRLWNAGYSFTVAAENLARGYRDAAAVLAGWQGSAGHQANLLRRDVSVAGIGVIESADTAERKRAGGPFWVLVVAQPRRR